MATSLTESAPATRGARATASRGHAGPVRKKA